MAKEKTKKRKLITPVFRLSFPNLKEPRAAQEGGKKKFGVQAIWDKSKFSEKDQKRWKAMLSELDRVSQEKFKKDWKKLPSSFKKGIRDGEDKEDLEGYGPGKKFASLTSSIRPGACDNVKGDDDKYIAIDLTEDSDRFYPGCYCRATVNAYAYDQGGGKGVALGLQNIQFVKDGPRLDNRTDAEDDFDEDIDSQWMDDEDDEDDRPKKKKKSRDEDDEDDEDERPRKKKKSRDEDEDDEADEDDDEDDRPRKKKKPRDEDEDEDDEDERPRKKKSRRDDDEDEDDEDDRPKKKKSRRDEDEDDDDF